MKLRFKQHQDGYVESTKNRRPLKLIYYEACFKQEDALKREKYLRRTMAECFSKTGSNLISQGRGKRKIPLLISYKRNTLFTEVWSKMGVK